MEPLNIETEKERLEHIGWRKMALELKEKLPHLRGKKRRKLLLQPSAVTGVRVNRLTQRRLYAVIAIISIGLNVWAYAVLLPDLKTEPSIAREQAIARQVLLTEGYRLVVQDLSAANLGYIKDYEGLSEDVEKAIKVSNKKVNEANKAIVKADKKEAHFNRLINKY